MTRREPTAATRRWTAWVGIPATIAAFTVGLAGLERFVPLVLILLGLTAAVSVSDGLRTGEIRSVRFGIRARRGERFTFWGIVVLHLLLATLFIGAGILQVLGLL